MRKFFVICAIIAVVSAVAFALSVAAFGVGENGWNITIGGRNIPFSIGDFGEASVVFNDNGAVTRYDSVASGQEYSLTFSSDPTEIELSTASCAAEIICSADAKTTVKFIAGSSASSGLSVNLDGGELKIEEKNLWFLNFGASRNAKVIVSLPQKQYESAKIAAMSGSCKIDGLICDRFESNAMSGSSDFNIYARKISLNSASGSQKLACCNGMRAESIKLESASGSREVNFLADEWEISSASGSTKITGIGGELDASTASGKVELIYTEWGGDLSVEAASGSTDVTLPEGSGVKLDYEGMSGGVDISLDGQSNSFKKSANATIGGTNVHSVELSTMSGSISIHN